MKRVSIEKQNTEDIKSRIEPSFNHLIKEENSKQFINKIQLILDPRANAMMEVFRSIPTGMFFKITNNTMVINNVITIYPKNSMTEEVFEL